MALATAVQGALRPAQPITWLDAEGNAFDLTGATLTGRIRNRATRTARDVEGTLTVTEAAAGEFTWAFSAEDVAEAGTFDVQFTATVAGEAARTFLAEWVVEEAL